MKKSRKEILNERNDRQTNELSSKTINANKDYIASLNILHSNKWNVWLNIASVVGVPATTIKKKLQQTLSTNGFPASSYKMFVAAKNNRIRGYVEVLADADGYIPVTEFISAVKSMRGLYEITCFQHNESEQVIDIVTDCKPSELLRTENLLKSEIDYAQIIHFFVTGFMTKRKRDNGYYPQNVEVRGTMNRKKVRFIPQINSMGNGYVWFYVDEYKDDFLKHQFFGAVVIRDRKPVPYSDKDKIYASNVGNKCLFVYVITRKSDGKIIYTGCTRTIETRAKRHFAPTESYMNNKSIPLNWDFYLKYGNLSITETNKKLFKNHKLDWSEYDIRFLPLTHYDKYVPTESVNKQSEHKKKLLPEAYIMDILEKEVPDKIVCSDAEMTFFCNEIKNKTHGVPLWYCTAEAEQNGVQNSTKLQVCTLLENNADIVNGKIPFNTDGAHHNRTTDFDSILRVTLEFLTGNNLHGVSWYDIFTKHALTLEQAMRYAVGLNINRPTELPKTKTEQHKEAVVRFLLNEANYKEVYSHGGNDEF